MRYPTLEVRLGNEEFKIRNFRDPTLGVVEASEAWNQYLKFNDMVDKMFKDKREAYIFTETVQAALEGRSLTRQQAETMWDELEVDDPPSQSELEAMTRRQLERAFKSTLEPD
jgi:hypothetical protein